MKKCIKHLWRCCIACATFLSAHPCIYSQVSNPSKWAAFVQGEENVSVRDTFRLQTFAGNSADNWKYSASEDVSIQDLTQIGIFGKHDKQGLQIPLNSKVVFERYRLDPYQDIIIGVHFSASHVMKGEELSARTYREEETSLPHFLVIKEDDYSTKFSTTSIVRTPKGLDLITPQPTANTRNGCYYVDSVFAHGLIPAFSLFTGTGNWNDTIRWTHLPAMRQRMALLNGEATIDSEVVCRAVSIGEGTLNIAESGELVVQTLAIHSNDNQPLSSGSLISRGEIHVKDKLKAQKTFAEKGKWFFIAFPFDVYAAGIDPKFKMSDDKQKTSGDYFYVRTYNGDKRSSAQSASNNWEVVSAEIAQSDQPIFKKNKGYLIALDAAASTNTLTFCSKEKEIPTDFGKNGAITITIQHPSEANTEHDGWFLCGNPLPMPLALRDLQANSALDGFVYVHDGNSYQSYAFDSDYALPPFSAFFVKAKESTVLTVQQGSNFRDAHLLDVNEPIAATFAEPKAGIVTSNESIQPNVVHFQFNRQSFVAHDLPSRGSVNIYNQEGKHVWSKPLPKGSSTHAHALPQGIYVVVVQSNGKITQEKVVLHP